MDEVASASKLVLSGVSSVSEGRLRGRLEVDAGFGEDDKRREGSTGGSDWSGFGDKW